MTSDLVLLLAQWRTDGNGIILAARSTDGGTEPIGGMKSLVLAEEVCAAHNERLDRLAHGGGHTK
jgi:hypothetical protein